ncbi:MAG: GPO family capsid scaffolding protein [Algicola sp.]|nr:GPO family capsid scaffolding protein [Algicola sp.]
MSVLRSRLLCIATAGATVDGRKIKPEWLTQAAANYKPLVYTALINWEHYSWAGNYGKVLSLTAKTVEDKVKLFAVLVPNQNLLAMNKAGEARFTSIEIDDSFADSGEAYLTGLAVTNRPASLGTTELEFSQRVGAGVLVSEPMAFSLELEDNEELTKFSQFTQWLSGSKKDEQAQQETEDSDKDDEMKPEQFTEMMAEIKKMGAVQTNAPPEKEEKPKPAGDGPGENKQLTDDFAALKTEFSALNKKIDDALNQETGFTQTGADTGETNIDVI